MFYRDVIEVIQLRNYTLPLCHLCDFGHYSLQ